MTNFKYMKLRGRIVEKFGSYTAFFNTLDVTPTQSSKKLNGKAGFSQEDIIEWCNRLDIDIKEVGSFFYA